METQNQDVSATSTTTSTTSTAPEQQQQAPVPMLPVLTDEPKQAEVKAKQQVISYSRKSTKLAPVADADKFRACIAPAFPSFRIYNPDEGEKDAEPQETFRTVLADKFAEVAGTLLKEYVLANPGAKEVPATVVSWNAVLERMQKDQTSERLNGETIAKWYDSTTMNAEALERYKDRGEQKQKESAAKLRSVYMSLASNNPSIKVDLAARMVIWMEKQDASHPVAAVVLSKLRKLQETAVSSDDL